MNIGLQLKGTILKYLDDGMVEVQLDQSSLITTNVPVYKVPMPLAFSGPSGEFIGGFPAPGTPVTLAQGQSQWYIGGYDKPNGLYTKTNLFSELTQDRLLLQTKDASNRIWLDPNVGISIGTIENSLDIDTERNILISTIPTEYKILNSKRSIESIIKRDVEDYLSRNIENSILKDSGYDDNLEVIGMDPSTQTSFVTKNKFIRNLPLTESREVIYEFVETEDNTIGFLRDEDEINKYNANTSQTNSFQTLKQNSRATAFSLNLNHPNHLIEIIKGTGVDSIGNIIDINRNILNIGKTKDNSFKNEDSLDAFRRLRIEHRKSLAYHFEINARKPGKKGTGTDTKEPIYTVPNPNDVSDMNRFKSTFFFDVDKEGQFKINVPSSSEVGNIPLLTRYESASNLGYFNNETSNPNLRYIDENRQDIFLESFVNYQSINLIGEDGYSAPLDRITEKPIKLGTAYHNILSTCFTFTDAQIKDVPLYGYLPNAQLSKNQNKLQYSNIVSNEIIISGPNANAGGRSGTINLDGSLSLSIGANTVDKQSLWLDTAGGIVASIGRDKRGISYAASLDGDLIIDLTGGPDPNTDSRFNNLNNGKRFSAFDIRVLTQGGIATIRIDNDGISILSPGRLEIGSQQDLILRSNSNITMEAPNISFFPDNPGMTRVIKRNGSPELA